MSAAELELLVDGVVQRIGVEIRDGAVVVREGGRVLEAAVRRISANELRLDPEGRPVRVFLAKDGERLWVAVDGRPYIVSELRGEAGRPGAGDDRGAGGGLRVKAPMPGKVTKLAVAEGEEVRRNQTLVIVEAMKMENEIKTSIDGVVTKIHAAAGESVDADRILVEIEPKAA
ncbi:MAG TPA: biotin/lipoyl-containing protein [Acidobacteriota bacterium]|nr:biotin/lipoyl-containing protein [Acidobacteriota bacterium]